MSVVWVYTYRCVHIYMWNNKKDKELCNKLEYNHIRNTSTSIHAKSNWFLDLIYPLTFNRFNRDAFWNSYWKMLCKLNTGVNTGVNIKPN